MSTLFQSEKDSVAFLGLMATAFRNFDFPFTHPDKQVTHGQGLNIFAGIVDQADGFLIGQQSNKIHSANNPMLHAEQLTLQEAIKAINAKRPRNQSSTSVENYYRNFMFSDCSIYTTLEPCPFCASALLVNRMKRIVYIIPDAKFGGAFSELKEKYYKTYVMSYEQLAITEFPESALTQFASQQYKKLLAEIAKIKQAEPGVYDTLLLDYLNWFLKECHEYFMKLTAKDLVTGEQEKLKNLATLTMFQYRA